METATLQTLLFRAVALQEDNMTIKAKAAKGPIAP